MAPHVCHGHRHGHAIVFFQIFTCRPGVGTRAPTINPQSKFNFAALKSENVCKKIGLPISIVRLGLWVNYKCFVVSVGWCAMYGGPAVCWVVGYLRGYATIHAASLSRLKPSLNACYS